MNRRTMLGLTAALMTSVAGLAATPAAAETEITMNVWFPRVTAFYTDYMMGWANAVEANSNGGIKVNVPAQSMAPPPGQLQLLLDGGADVVMIINAYHNDKFMLPMVGALPFTADSEEGAHVALWRTYEKFFADVGEYKGLKVLGLTMPSANAIQSLGDPITSVADFKGRKVRTDPGPMLGFLEQAGATPVVRPANESFELMSGGVIDASLMTGEGAMSLDYLQFLKNVTTFPGGLGRFVFTFAMSQEKWDTLTPEEQKIVEDAAGEALGRAYGQLLDKREEMAATAHAEAGVNVIEANEAQTAEFKDALDFLTQGWIAGATAKGADGAAAYEYFVTTAANPG